MLACLGGFAGVAGLLLLLGVRWVLLRRVRDRRRRRAAGLIPGEERCRVVMSLPSTAEMGSGGAAAALGPGCSSVSAATREPSLRLTCRWPSMTESVTAGCPPPALTLGEGRCLG
jgi:hypothetical protein